MSLLFSVSVASPPVVAGASQTRSPSVSGGLCWINLIGLPSALCRHCVGLSLRLPPRGGESQSMSETTRSNPVCNERMRVFFFGASAPVSTLLSADQRVVAEDHSTISGDWIVRSQWCLSSPLVTCVETQRQSYSSSELLSTLCECLSESAVLCVCRIASSRRWSITDQVTFCFWRPLLDRPHRSAKCPPPSLHRSVSAPSAAWRGESVDV